MILECCLGLIWLLLVAVIAILAFLLLIDLWVKWEW
jgi:hypothetical protein